MKKLLKVSTFLIFIYLTVVLAAFFLQKKFILQAKTLPPDYHFQFSFTSNFQELNFQNGNAKINALYFPVENAKGCIFYLHGNAHSMEYYGEFAQDFTKKGYSVFLYDYRGFGKSTGSISEAAFHEDSQWLFNEVQNKFQLNPSDLIIYGRSLGSGPATHLASKEKARCLILETPYSNMIDMVKHYLPLVPFSEKWLDFTFRSDIWIQEVTYPKYIFHGTSDWVIPYKYALKLRPYLNKPSHFITIPDGGHKNLREFEDYHNYLEQFLNIEL